jgi:hypothetical protein
MARPKRVIRVKLFRRWFIIYDCIKFRLILSKSPQNLPRICLLLCLLFFDLASFMSCLPMWCYATTASGYTDNLSFFLPSVLLFSFPLLLLQNSMMMAIHIQTVKDLRRTSWCVRYGI